MQVNNKKNSIEKSIGMEIVVISYKLQLLAVFVSFMYIQFIFIYISSKYISIELFCHGGLVLLIVYHFDGVNDIDILI